MTMSTFRERIYELELKHGRSEFYELPDNHPDMKGLRNLLPKDFKVKENKMDRWIEEHGNKLSELCEKMNVDELSDFFNLSITSIKSRLNRMGLKAMPKPDRRRIGYNVKIEWTEKDEQRLIDIYKEKTTGEIAEEFGVSDSSVFKKARELGLTKGKRVMMMALNYHPLREFENANEVEEKLYFRPASVRKACSTGMPYKGHYWQYI